MTDQAESSTSLSADQAKKPRSRPRVPDSPEVRLSKRLSYILRHGAGKEKLPIRDDGYVAVNVILQHSSFRGVSFADIQRIVNTNEKARFKLIYNGDDDNSIEIDNNNNNNNNNNNGSSIDTLSGHGWLIRANQGHSLAVNLLELDAITDATQFPIAVHGTRLTVWNDHIKTKGLSKMKRNHIHMATGLPNHEGVISGMRNSSNVYVYVNLEKALQDGIKFFKSANGVILSEGINGILEPKYFAKVEDSAGNSLL
ncbi:phosphotransferase KptA/Tpt1 [Lipomyces japonicus]|uniref:phosphotransferase KptA/Tpt1 n=1 Tax=Lipomyces japonicus TaxID=56871 RepID=UPI0034CDDFA3